MRVLLNTEKSGHILNRIYNCTKL